MQPDTDSTGKLGARSRNAIAEMFVGRKRERELFRQAMLAARPPFALLTILGPGGIGKTALLDQFRIIAEKQGIACASLDARHIEPAPAAFEDAVSRSLGFHPLEPVPQRFVLLIDTFEALEPLGSWLFDQFVPSMPDCSVMVLASRNGKLSPPSALAPLAYTIRLRNLEPAESHELLDRRNIESAERDSLIAASFGHPLALSIAADTLVQAGRIGPLERLNIVRTLLDRLIESAPTPAHREALEIAAHARITTEALLSEAIDAEQAPALFEWLAGLSFMEFGADGLFPHDLAREIIHGDLAWRNAARLRDINKRVRKHYLRRFRDGLLSERLRALQDLVFLHRVNPIMRAFFEFNTIGHVWLERAAPGDLPGILSLIEHFERAASARLARHWMDRQPSCFFALRSAGEPLVGAYCQLDLTQVTERDEAVDPIVAEAIRFVASDPPKLGEAAILSRFMFARQTYQAPSPATTAVQVHTYIAWMTTPCLSWSLLALDADTPWEDLMRYIDFAPAGACIGSIPPRHYRLFAHDWRRIDPAAWFDAMEEREIDIGLTPAHVTPMDERVVMLAEGPFRNCVHDALRRLSSDSGLASNPLLRSRILTRSTDNPRPCDLRTVLCDAAEELRVLPRGAKFYRAIELTYLRPAPSQEAAAERLGIPFGTYRYHLTRGIECIGDRLWSLECERPVGD